MKSQAAKASQKKIDLRFETVAGPQPTLLGDPLRVRQIATNLLSNAIKFTDRGSVVVKLDFAPGADGHVNVILEVSDTGPGIPADKLPTIFEKFTQADGSITRKYGGTGLGLAITRRLVDMHGGDIRVDSQVGKGSTFRVTLLCEPAPAAAPARSPVRKETMDPAIQNAAAVRLLVVEDNLVNQKVVLAILFIRKKRLSHRRGERRPGGAREAQRSQLRSGFNGRPDADSRRPGSHPPHPHRSALGSTSRSRDDRPRDERRSRALFTGRNERLDFEARATRTFDFDHRTAARFERRPPSHFAAALVPAGTHPHRPPDAARFRHDERHAAAVPADRAGSSRPHRNRSRPWRPRRAPSGSQKDQRRRRPAFLRQPPRMHAQDRTGRRQRGLHASQTRSGRSARRGPFARLAHRHGSSFLEGRAFLEHAPLQAKPTVGIWPVFATAITIITPACNRIGDYQSRPRPGRLPAAC